MRERHVDKPAAKRAEDKRRPITLEDLDVEELERRIEQAAANASYDCITH
jgi:hypothetical protein